MRRVVAMCALAGALPACVSNATGAAGRTTLTVLAASSLTDAFEDAGAAFEATRPEVKVRFSFAASPLLVTQVDAGAPADVIATADRESLAKLRANSLVSVETVVARNTLALVVPKDNPAAVRSARDLARSGVDLVLCAPEVPCGRLAAAALSDAHIGVRPRSLEENVRAVLGKVTSGEADAGIVYRTDARAAASQVAEVAFPEGEGHFAVYPVAVVKSGDHARDARAFVEFLATGAARTIFARYGFLEP